MFVARRPDTPSHGESGNMTDERQSSVEVFPGQVPVMCLQHCPFVHLEHMLGRAEAPHCGNSWMGRVRCHAHAEHVLFVYWRGLLLRCLQDTS
jgi:hypothetical protein